MSLVGHSPVLRWIVGSKEVSLLDTTPIVESLTQAADGFGEAAGTRSESILLAAQNQWDRAKRLCREMNLDDLIGKVYKRLYEIDGGDSLDPHYGEHSFESIHPLKKARVIREALPSTLYFAIESRAERIRSLEPVSPPPDFSTARAISLLRRSTFFQTPRLRHLPEELEICHSFYQEDVKYHLTLIKDQLNRKVWRLFNELTKEISWIPADSATKQFLRELRSKTIVAQIEYSMDYNFNITVNGSGRLTEVKLENTHRRSLGGLKHTWKSRSHEMRLYNVDPLITYLKRAAESFQRAEETASREDAALFQFQMLEAQIYWNAAVSACQQMDRQQLEFDVHNEIWMNNGRPENAWEFGKRVLESDSAVPKKRAEAITMVLNRVFQNHHEAKYELKGPDGRRPVVSPPAWSYYCDPIPDYNLTPCFRHCPEFPWRSSIYPNAGARSTGLTLNPLLKGEELVWVLVVDNTSSWVVANGKSREIRETLRSISQETEKENFLKNFKFTVHLVGGALSAVDIQEVTCQSQLDPHVLLRWDRRAITLISGGPCIDLPVLDRVEGHAEIVTEGLEGGQYYRTFSHLVSDLVSNKAIVKHVKQLNPQGEIKYRAKTRTWPRSQQIVSNMMTHIASQVDQPQSFNLFWKNCAKWTGDTLPKANISVPEISGVVNGTESYIEQINAANIP